ncbi:MAG: hypothetical protein ACXQT3_05525 [Methermicoccaceae archaeon]
MSEQIGTSSIQRHINLLKRTVAALEDEILRGDATPRCHLCGGVLVQKRNEHGGVMPWMRCTECGEYFQLVQEVGHVVRE